jgi:hypothetical protein
MLDTTGSDKVHYSYDSRGQLFSFSLNGTLKQKRWYSPDGNAEMDRDYNYPGDMPFPHDFEWKDGIRQPGHLPPDPSYEFRWEPVLGVGLVVVCAVGII